MKTQGFAPLLAGKARVFGAGHFCPCDLAASWWKPSFPARPPSKSASCCKSVLQRKLSCETSVNSCKWSFGCGAVVPDLLQTLQVEVVKTRFSVRRPSKTSLCNDGSLQSFLSFFAVKTFLWIRSYLSTYLSLHTHIVSLHVPHSNPQQTLNIP